MCCHQLRLHHFVRCAHMTTSVCTWHCAWLRQTACTSDACMLKSCKLQRNKLTKCTCDHCELAQRNPVGTIQHAPARADRPLPIVYAVIHVKDLLSEIRVAVEALDGKDRLASRSALKARAPSLSSTSFASLRLASSVASPCSRNDAVARCWCTQLASFSTQVSSAGQC